MGETTRRETTSADSGAPVEQLARHLDGCARCAEVARFGGPLCAVALDLAAHLDAPESSS